MTDIVTLTLNPALDLSTSAAAVHPGEKLRCEAPVIDPGGGGANVSRALAILGQPSRALIATGGATGATYRVRTEAEGLAVHWLEAPGETRQSLSVTDRETGAQYRFILPGARWTAADAERVLDAALAEIRKETLAVLSGSLPPGVAPGFARDFAAGVAAAGGRAILDLSGAALADVADGRPGAAHILRMDRFEAGELLAGPPPDAPGARALADRLVAAGTAEIVVVTLGGDGAVAVTATEAWRVTPPAVEVVSATGAGDCFVAGLAIGCTGEHDLGATLAHAMAAATSAVRTEATALCSAEGFGAYLPRVSVLRLS